MSEKLPWFKFFPFDWLSDTTVQTMTLSERGFYLEILCRIWIEGGIKNDRTHVQRMFNTCAANDEECSTHVREKIVDKIISCLDVTKDGEKLTHWKLEELREENAKTIEKRRKAGQKSGEARRKKKSNTCLTPVEHMMNKPEPEPEIDNKKKKIYKKEINHPSSIDEAVTYFISKGMDQATAAVQAEIMQEYFDPEKSGVWTDKTGKRLGSWKRNAANWFLNWQSKQTNGINRLSADKTSRPKPELIETTL